MAYTVAGRGSYSPPVDGPMGRTDEGVDWGTTPGEPVKSIGAAIVEFVGRYSGFGPYVAYRLTEGPAAGQRIFSAEHARTLVHPGQRIRRGQTIGRAATGIEVGFAQGQPTYLPLAQVEPGGYHEGEETAAGRRFRALMQGAQQVQDAVRLPELWTDAGGSPHLANIMAAIALAESGGRVDAVGGPNSDGSYDYGIWQINSSHHYSRRRLLSDPLYNAGAAVAIERTQGLDAWTTYRTGAYRAHLNEQGPTYQEGTGQPPRRRPGGQQADADAQANQNQDVSWREYLNPKVPFTPFHIFFNDPRQLFGEAQKAVSGTTSFLKWIAWMFHPRNILRAVEFLSGAGLVAVGIASALKVFDSPGSSSSSSPGVKRYGTVRRKVAASGSIGRAAATGGPGAAVAQTARSARKARRARSERRLSQSEGIPF